MTASRRHEPDFFTCPHCGAAVPMGSISCRQCGSDAETGWSEKADRWHADIPTGFGEDDEFDYDDFVAREFPEHANPSARYVIRRWMVGVIFILVGLAFLLWSVLP